MRYLAFALALLLSTPAWATIPVIQTRNERKEPSTVSTTSIPPPASIADGDVLVICTATDGGSVFTWPTGFIEIDQQIVGSGGGLASIGGSYKIASGESGNYIVTWTGGVEKAISEIYRIDGAISGDEIQDPGENSATASATQTITPILATDTDDSLVMVCFGMDDDDVTIDGGGDGDYVTEDVDESDASAGSTSIGVQSKGIATAAVPPQCDLTLTASEDGGAFWFAVRSIVPIGGLANDMRIIN